MTAADYQAQYGRGQPTQAAPAKGKPKASPANALTKAVVALLALHGYHAWRQNNAAVYDPTRQVFRAGSATPGISDVLGYCRRTGRFAAVEVKVGKDKLSPEQTEFLAGVRKAGGFACEGRSLDQVQAELLAYLST